MREEIERLSSRVDSHEETLKNVKTRMDDHGKRISDLETGQKKIKHDTGKTVRGLYGDKDNKVVGVIAKINILMLLHFGVGAAIVYALFPPKVQDIIDFLFGIL